MSDDPIAPLIAAARAPKPTRVNDTPVLSVLERVTDFAVLAPLPLALLSASLIAVLVVGTQPRLRQRYADTAAGALESGDFDTALVAYGRLVEMDPSEDEFVFGLTKAAMATGQDRRAAALQSRLLNFEDRGFDAAHLWYAKRLLTVPEPTRETVSEAERHLRHILKSEPAHAEVHRLLCELCLNCGRLSEAEEHLLASPESTRIEFRRRLAYGFHRVGDREKAAEYARHVEPYYWQRIFRDPDDAEMRRIMAETLVLQARYEEAHECLLDSNIDPSEPATEAALGGVCLAWAESLNGQPSEAGRREELAREAVARLERGPAGPGRDEQLAYAWLMLRDLSRAEPYLTRAAARDRRLLLELARLHGVEGRTDQAVATAEEASATYSAALRLEPENETLRLLAADAAFLLRRYPDAVQILEAGRRPGRPSVMLDRALARTLTGWFDALDPGGGAAYRRLALELLEGSYAADPWNIEALNRLDQLRLEWAANDERAAALLDKLLETELPPAPVLALFGARALALNDPGRAAGLLERAYDADPTALETANHLAWALALCSPPQLERAEIVCDRALDRLDHTDDVRDRRALLRGTRGMVRAKLEKWDLARLDLEAAASVLDGKVEFHRLLADAYEHCNQPDLSAEQRERYRRASLAAKADTGR